jgi:hypothetical protein
MATISEVLLLFEQTPMKSQIVHFNMSNIFVDFFLRKTRCLTVFLVIKFHLTHVYISIIYYCYEFLFINIFIANMLDAKSPANFW